MYQSKLHLTGDEAGEGGYEPDIHQLFIIYLPLMLDGGEKGGSIRVDLLKWGILRAVFID